MVFSGIRYTPPTHTHTPPQVDAEQMVRRPLHLIYTRFTPDLLLIHTLLFLAQVDAEMKLRNGNKRV
jgi:hypothetical protein